MFLFYLKTLKKVLLKNSNSYFKTRIISSFSRFPIVFTLLVVSYLQIKETSMELFLKAMENILMSISSLNEQSERIFSLCVVQIHNLLYFSIWFDFFEHHYTQNASITKLAVKLHIYKNKINKTIN